MASARGEWDEAGKILRGLLEEAQEQQDETQQDDNANYAVSSFFFFLQQNGIWFSLFFLALLNDERWDADRAAAAFTDRLLITWRWHFLVKAS